MAGLPKKLQKKITDRQHQNALRKLARRVNLTDFSSNDYLGISSNADIGRRAAQMLTEKGIVKSGATGSRLLSGNHMFYFLLEKTLSEFHRSEAALVFNSGYDANIGFFSSVPQRGDLVFYDEYAHASIRDGIKMGNAKSHKFKHNDLEDLKLRVARRRNASGENSQMSALSEAEVYVVTESVFSMDGDSPDLTTLANFCKKNNFKLIVDEAHAVGVFGERGEGLIQEMNLEDTVFARVVTFGKALGCHGAAILGCAALKDYLVNFARSLIYSTGLPPHTVATVLAAYAHFDFQGKAITQLRENISFFDQELESLVPSQVEGLQLKSFFIPSNSAIHCCVISGNDRVKRCAHRLQDEGFDVRPILSPTVPEGQERLRICLHSFNTKEEIKNMLELLLSLI